VLKIWGCDGITGKWLLGTGVGVIVGSSRVLRVCAGKKELSKVESVSVFLPWLRAYDLG